MIKHNLNFWNVISLTYAITLPEVSGICVYYRIHELNSMLA